MPRETITPLPPAYKGTETRVQWRGKEVERQNLGQRTDFPLLGTLGATLSSKQRALSRGQTLVHIRRSSTYSTVVDRVTAMCMPGTGDATAAIETDTTPVLPPSEKDTLENNYSRNESQLGRGEQKISRYGNI